MGILFFSKSLAAQNNKWEGVFSTTYPDNSSPYARGLFFYYLVSQPSLQISFIKKLLTNFETMQDVNSNNYFDKMKGLFELANFQMPNSGFNSSDEIIASFASQFIKKQFLSNLLNYNNQDLFLLQYMNGNALDCALVNYAGISTHKEVASANGQMSVTIQARPEDGQYGDFYCAVGVWDNNNNFVESSFQELYMNQELYTWDPVVDVNQGYKVMAIVVKLNEIGVPETDTYFLKMQFHESGAPLTCDFCSNYEFTNYSNNPRVEIAAQNEVIFYPITTGDGLSYNWVFSGGTPYLSTEMSPTVYYATQGHFNVELTVTNALEESCNIVKQVYVIVWPPENTVASFTVNGSTIVNPGDLVQFVNTSFNASSYNWSFNGGTPLSSNEENPVVTFSSPGSHTVGLTAHLAGSPDHGITKSNYITVLNPNSLIINCVVNELVMPNESSYATVHLEAVPSSDVYYTYVFDFGDGIINEIVTNEIWVSSDWHSYSFPNDYNFQVTVYNSNNVMVAACGKIISVRDMFQPVYVNLVVEPEHPALGQPFTIYVETDAYGERSYTWYANGVQFNNPFDFRSHTISQSGSYTYKVVVQDFSGRLAGEDEITLFYEDPGNCIVARVDWENSCFQYGESMFIKSTSYCSNSDECFAFEGNNQLNQITDLRWTLVRGRYETVQFLGQEHCNYDELGCDICNISLPSFVGGSGMYFLILEVWNNFESSNLNISNYSLEQIIESNDHLQNAFYDKIWINLEPSGGLDYSGTSVLCGWHPSNKTYTKKKIFGANNTGCSYTIAASETINFFAKEEITLQKGFSAMHNANFTAKISCGMVPFIFYSRPSHLNTRNSEIVSCQIFPNPTSNNLYIDCSTILSNSDTKLVKVAICDLLGKELISNSYFNTSIIGINLESLLPAEYYVNISSQNIEFNKKFIKQ